MLVGDPAGFLRPAETGGRQPRTATWSGCWIPARLRDAFSGLSRLSGEGMVR